MICCKQENINEYEKENNRLSFANVCNETLRHGMILNNDIISHGSFEIQNGELYDEEYESYVEIFQYYIISENDVDELLRVMPDEIIFYSDELDVTLLGITHYGTSWAYTLTDVKLDDVNLY